MKSLWVFISLFGLASLAPPRGKIIGGHAVPIEETPYHIQLDQAVFGVFFDFACGAVIVGPNSFLTAAHCLEDPFDGPVPLQVRSGSNKVDEGVVHEVVSSIAHPDYSAEESIYVNDIAFCTVSPSFKFSNTTQPIVIAKTAAQTGDEATLSGWGGTMNTDTASEFLLTVTVPILDQLDCNDWYAVYGYNSNVSFCAGQPLYHKDFCDQDEGGPLVMNGELVGIASLRDDCSDIFNPGIYTNVTVFASWISEQLAIAEKELAALNTKS